MNNYGASISIRLRGTKKELRLALKKLEEVFEVVKHPKKDYPNRRNPQLIHWYLTVELPEEDQNARSEKHLKG